MKVTGYKIYHNPYERVPFRLDIKVEVKSGWFTWSEYTKGPFYFTTKELLLERLPSLINEIENNYYKLLEEVDLR